MAEDPKVQKRKRLSIADVAKQIYQICHNLPPQVSRRDVHMLNMALAGFKYLITNSLSDEVRLEACKAVVDLPIVQARMSLMVKKIVTEQHHHQHLHLESGDVSRQLAQLLVGANPAALRALEAAESQIVPVKAEQETTNR